VGGSLTGGTGATTSEGGGSTSGAGGTIEPPARPPSAHRAEALSCEGVHDPPEPADRWAPEYDCLEHADCTDGENGKCIGGDRYMGLNSFCVYDACRTDADCDPGEVCYCAVSTWARCLFFGNCQIDADCGPGGYCSPSGSEDCGGHRSIDGYYCHTPHDTCIDNADCTGTDYCNFNVYNDRWECTAVDDTCVIG